MDRDTAIRIEELETDVAALQFLVEVLFVWRLKGLNFSKFRSDLLAQMDEATVPGVDPAQSDHASQLVAERMTPILDSIARRLGRSGETDRPFQTDA